MQLERLDAAEVAPAGRRRRGRCAGCARSSPAASRSPTRSRDRAGVRERGDAAVLRLHRAASTPPAASRRRCSSTPTSSTRRSRAAAASWSPACRSRSPTSRWSPRRASAQDGDVELPQGQRVRLREIPVGSRRRLRARRARALPEHRRDGRRHRARGRRRATSSSARRRAPTARSTRSILGACRLCGVERVYRMGGAQAIAALAYGTETVERRRRDRRPGQPLRPGGQAPAVGDRSASTASPGPSDLLVVLRRTTPGARVRLVALDLLAQAEHGEGSLVVAVSPSQDGCGRARRRRCERRSSSARRSAMRPFADRAASRRRAGRDRARQRVRARAPAADRRRRRGARAASVRRAGCLFVGVESATAFGDYVAGSNHVLPTGGAARFASALSPAPLPPQDGRGADRRRRAAKLAAAGAPIARAEGFEVHAESMEARIGENEPT